MAQAAVATDLLQALDVLRALPAEIAFDDNGVVDQVTKLDNLVLGQVADLAVRLDPDSASSLLDVGRPIP